MSYSFAAFGHLKDWAESNPDAARELFAVMMKIERATKDSPGFAVSVACMALLDGAEASSGSPAEKKMIKDWHERAYKGLRSWERKPGGC